MNKTATHAHGFADLRSSDPDLYRQWTGHIRKCFDQYDWGFKHVNGGKPRKNKKENLNVWFNRDIPLSVKKFAKRPVSLSLRRIEENMTGYRAHYYTSHPFSRFAVLMLDFDDHDGTAGDATGAFNHIKDAYFPAAYDQPSDRGHHGYVFVKYPDMEVKQFRVVCRLLQSTLRHDLASRGFRCQFEVKGTPGLLERNGAYRTCGLFGRIPILPNNASIRSYLTRTVYRSDHLLDVLRRAGANLPPSASPSSVIDMKQPTSVSYLFPQEGGEKGRGKAEQEDKDGGGGEGPCERMNGHARQLARELGRPITAVELLASYETRGLGTGADEDGNRWKLAQEAAEWISRTYDSCKAHGFDAGCMTQTVRQYLTDDIRKSVRKSNRSTYTDEQVAVVLYTVERSATTRNPNPWLQWTVPNDSITAMFEAVGMELDGNENQQRMRLAAMKLALVRAGLIEVLDASWTYGKGKCYGLGANHPEREKYVKFRNQIEAERN